MPEILEMANRSIVELAKRRALNSTLYHAQYFFEKVKREPFIVNPHHIIICDALDKVFRGEIKKLIINVAPRYTKTELAVKTFIQKGLAHNPKSKYIHLSYSDTLALDNSDTIRESCKSPFYQQLFPAVKISRKSDSKKKWYTTEGGGVYATAAAGQVTGFGAGAVDHSENDKEVLEFTQALSELEEIYTSQDNTMGWKDPYSKFGGAILIDDPIKPEDALSDVKRNRINERFDSTIRNRVNSKTTPIIIVHQRVHENDLTGHLLSIEPEEWTVIKLPCIKEDGTPLWPLKHTLDELLHLRKIGPYVFESQYQQDPKPVKRGGEFYKLFDAKTNVVKNPKGADGKPTLYDPKVPLHVTFDFNVVPYMGIGIWQIWGKKAIKIDEVVAKSPNNRTDAASREVFRRYQGHTGGTFIYGDPSGKKEDTRTERGSNDYTIIIRALSQLKPTLRVDPSAPPVAMRGNFINTLFADGFEGVEIFIGDNCTKSIEDYQFTKEDSDGTKLKKRETDPDSGLSAEKYGHLSDGDDYFICRAFAPQFIRYQKGGIQKKISQGRNSSANSY